MDPSIIDMDDWTRSDLDDGDNFNGTNSNSTGGSGSRGYNNMFRENYLMEPFDKD